MTIQIKYKSVTQRKPAHHQNSVKIWFHLYYIQNTNTIYVLKCTHSVFIKLGQCLHSIKTKFTLIIIHFGERKGKVLAHRKVNIHGDPYLQKNNGSGEETQTAGKTAGFSRHFCPPESSHKWPCQCLSVWAQTYQWFQEIAYLTWSKWGGKKHHA